LVSLNPYFRLIDFGITQLESNKEEEAESWRYRGGDDGEGAGLGLWADHRAHLALLVKAGPHLKNKVTSGGASSISTGVSNSLY